MEKQKAPKEPLPESGSVRAASALPETEQGLQSQVKPDKKIYVSEIIIGLCVFSGIALRFVNKSLAVPGLSILSFLLIGIACFVLLFSLSATKNRRKKIGGIVLGGIIVVAVLISIIFQL